MNFKHVAVPLFLLAITAFVLVIAMVVLNLTGCHDPLVAHIQRRYPGCDVVKIEDGAFGYKEVTIQCPLQPPKTVRVKPQK